MRKLLLIVAVMGCASPPDEFAEMRRAIESATGDVVAKQQQSIDILQDNTDALRTLAGQIDTLEASLATPKPQQLGDDPASPSEPQEKSPPATPSGEATPAVRLYITHADFHCPPCEALKAAVNRGELAGFEVIDSDPFPGLRSYPAIRFQDPTGQWKVIYGFDGNTVATLHKLTSPQQTAVPSPPIVTQSAMAYGDMVALHNQLHGGGQWTWRGDPATHLREVHGVQTGGQPVGAIFPVSRSSTIVNSGPVVRFVPQRVSFVGRSRTKTRKSCPPSGCP